MEARRNVAQQIGKIKDIFQHAQILATAGEDVNQLIADLEKADPEFRSIAYEGASMSLALSDLSRGEILTRWSSLLEGPGAAHATQIYVGLGWALAQQQIPVSHYVERLDPLLGFRVADGHGYFDGLLRSRQAIKNQKRPEDLPEKFFPAYDQGVGRSLWYSSLGEHFKIPEIMDRFVPLRHPDLWRGIGIAVAYVGGFETTTLVELAAAASQYRVPLAIGAALAARARWQANSLTPDAEMACRVWCHCSAEQAVMLTVNAEPSATQNPAAVFKNWISKMELAFLPV